MAVILGDKWRVTRDTLRNIKSHKDLDVWQKSMNFVVEIYKRTKQFPDEEKFGLKTKLQRAAISIPSNIAEGAARNGKKEFIQFLYIALGSLAEVETQLEIAKRLKYVDNISQVKKDLTDIRRMVQGLINYLKKNWSSTSYALRVTCHEYGDQRWTLSPGSRDEIPLQGRAGTSKKSYGSYYYYYQYYHYYGDSKK